MSIYPPIPDTPTPTREAYNAAHFVGREEDLRAIRRKIEEGQAGYPITRPVIHLWGAPGIGKSWLLQHIYTEFSAKTEDSAKLHTRGILTALVDFTKLPFKAEDPSSVKALLQALQDGLQRGETPAPDDSEDKGAISVGHFIQDVIEWSQRFIIVLLFDSVEKLPPDDFFWLEREIIAPLARTDRVLFVIASRKELPRWKEFSVRQRLEVWELQGFDLQTTQEQLTRYALPEEVAREIYPYTFGHPYANQILGAAWQEGKPSAEKIPIFLSQIEKELLENAVLERERDILRALSTLRRFNVESARRFLKQAVDPEFGALSDGYYLRLFEMLEQTNLIFWNSEQRGYVFSREVRGILQSRLKLAEPERYQELHQHALEMYQQWIEHYQGQEERFFPEMLYHCIQQYCGDATVLHREVIALLERWLTPDHFNGEQLDSLYHLIVADPELGAALPSTLYEEILTRIEQQKNEPMKEATSCSS